MYNEIMDDLKLQDLSDFEFKMWIYCLCMASEISQDGSLGTHDAKKLAWRFRVDPTKFVETIAKFEILGMIKENESGIYFINNWKKRQYESDDINKRVNKHREMKRYNETLHVTGDVTSQNRYRTDSDTDTDNKNTAPPSDETAFFNAVRLRITDFNRNQLNKLIERNSLEYLVRKFFYLMFRCETNPPDDSRRFLFDSIKNKYVEPDSFWEWWKVRKNQLIDSKNVDDNIKQIAGLL